jgi:hypothetical protein
METAISQESIHKIPYLVSDNMHYADFDFRAFTGAMFYDYGRIL